MCNLFYYETDLGIIGIKDNKKAITEIFYAKMKINDNIKEKLLNIEKRVVNKGEI